MVRLLTFDEAITPGLVIGFIARADQSIGTADAD